jgi:hypothetical protein
MEAATAVVAAAAIVVVVMVTATISAAGIMGAAIFTAGRHTIVRFPHTVHSPHIA